MRSDYENYLDYVALDALLPHEDDLDPGDNN